MTPFEFAYTQAQFEEVADQVKTVVLGALFNDGTLSPEVADDWAANHTVIFRKKSFFRTVFDRWIKTPEEEGQMKLLVVKLVKEKGAEG